MATNNAINLAAGSSDQLTQSAGTGTPGWTTSTYPVTNAINTLLYASAANVMSALPTANSGTLITSAGGVPSISSTLPTAVQSNITQLGIQAQTLDMGLNLISNLAMPVSATDAVTKSYVDSLVAGGASPTYAATTADLTVTQSGAGIGATLTNADTQATFSTDGTTPPLNSRILVIFQSSQSQNGIYTLTDVGSGATNWVLTRATDYDTPAKINSTGLIPVINGTLYATTGWFNTTHMVTVDTTIITYVSFNNITYPISLSHGGTNANLTASNGGVFYSTGSAGAILSGTATANQVLLSGSNAAPAWSSATYPASTTINQLLYSSSANVIAGLATGNNGVLITSAGGIPSISSTLPSAVQANITAVGTVASGVWHGTAIDETHGGTNQTSYALGDTLYASAANTLSKLSGNITSGIQYLSQTGTGAVSAAPVWATISGGDITGAALTKTDDTNVTLTLGGTPATALLRAASLALGWTGQLGLTRGGTNASLTASNGGIVYSTSSALAILSGTVTAGQMLQSGSSAAPAWSTSTYPATNAISTLLYASAANVMSALATANNGMLVTSSTGVPSILAGPGTTGNVLQSNAAAAPSFSTATYPSVATGTGTLLRADGTNWVATTSTYPNTNAISTLLYASSANVMSALPTANSGVLVTSSTGVPSILAAGTTGQVLQASTSGTPAWSTPTYPTTSGSSGKIIVSDGTNNVYSTPTFPNSSASAGKIIISDGTNWVASTPTYPNTSGAAGKVVVSDGTNNVYSTPTFPNASATTRKIIVSDGTNWVASTETYAVPGSSGNVLTSDGTNWTSAAPTVTSPLTTKGDIFVYSTTNTRLPVAVGDGKILQVSSGDTTGLAYSTPTYPSASGTAGQLLRSDGTNNAYSTSTYPNTNAINTLLYASASNVMSALATANSGVLVTSGSGVPAILAAGTTGQVLQASTAGTPAWSTPTYPAASGTAGQLLRSDGTNIAYSTSTYPNTNAINTLLYASTANVMSALATANSGVLVTSSTGVPSILAAGTTGQVLQASTAGTPAWSTPTYPSTSGSAGKVVVSDGTNNVYSTPTFPNASATTRKIIVSDGTNWVASTETYAVPGTSGNVLTSNGTNWTSAPPSGGGLTWTDVTGTSQAMAANNGYIANNGSSLVTLTLPVTCALGGILEVVGRGAAGWKIALNAGQSIFFGTAQTTGSGFLASTLANDCARLVCLIADTRFQVVSGVGNMTVA